MWEIPGDPARVFEGPEAALWTALASRAREHILEGTLGAATSGECTGLPYFDRLSPPEKLVLVSNSMIALLCRSVPPPPMSLFAELPMYALAAVLEQEMMRELNVGSWDKVPEKKLGESAVSRLMDLTRWRRLVLPAHKHAYPDRWQNRTKALQTLPLFEGEKNPKPWREAVYQLSERLGLTEEGRRMYATLQTPG